MRQYLAKPKEMSAMEQGNISVSNVSTVHINYTPTSTYTIIKCWALRLVVLSGSAQHWIHGATKGHKIVPGEFRDFIYTTDGWVASVCRL